MLAQLLLAFGLIVLSLAGLGIGLLLGRGAPRGTCATATLSEDGNCPLCGRECAEKERSR